MCSSNVLLFIVMYLLAGNDDANLTHAEDDARAQNDHAGATKLRGPR